MLIATCGIGGGLKKDFEKASALQQKTALHFEDFLDLLPSPHPKIRIRFSTSNPQDMSRGSFKSDEKIR